MWEYEYAIYLAKDPYFVGFDEATFKEYFYGTLNEVAEYVRTLQTNCACYAFFVRGESIAYLM